VCFGQDHQYAIPFGLARELSVDACEWRDALDRLATGGYGDAAPPFGHPKAFASRFNEWLVARGNRSYFYSATKTKQYGVPSRSPRPGDSTAYRLTELRRSASGAGSPKPFNRIGDPGSVGGQTLVGMLAVRRLLRECHESGIRVAAWPFDGLSLSDTAYADAHVLVEPYPTAARAIGVPQSDDSDALASAGQVRIADANGRLHALCDLSCLGREEASQVRREGWIVSHRPELQRTSVTWKK
jgi:hypothetical protein